MAPIATTILSSAPQWDPSVITSSSLVGLICMILDLIAIVEILNSPRSTANKLLWTLAIFLMPFVGLLAYYLLADRQTRRLRYISIS